MPHGRHSDGGNLYLVVSESGARRWAFIYRAPNGKQREMGLGPAGRNGVSLATARDLAAEAREHLQRGRDPLDERHTERVIVKTQSFGEFADQYVNDHEAGWKNPKHVAQWRMTLTDYAEPIRSKPINEITVSDLQEVLRPIWSEIPETARRLRGRIEEVLDAARVKGLRAGDNPARWKGNLEHLLLNHKKGEENHHAALDYPETPGFVAKLRLNGTLASRAFEFMILTATRTGETIGAKFEEFDLEKAIWTIPPERMKAERSHRVPLSPRVLEIVQEALATRNPANPYVFPGRNRGKPLSNMTFLKIIERMGYADVTGHGFRSSFDDWACEETDTPFEVSEMALAHVIKSKTARAYRRGDLLEKRRVLMDKWATFVCNMADLDDEQYIVTAKTSWSVVKRRPDGEEAVVEVTESEIDANVTAYRLNCALQQARMGKQDGNRSQ